MVVFEELDLREEEKLDNIFAKHGPFASVIHFAGLKAVGESCEKPLSYYDNNVIGTIALLKVMAKHGTENIVFSIVLKKLPFWIKARSSTPSFSLIRSQSPLKS